MGVREQHVWVGVVHRVADHRAVAADLGELLAGGRSVGGGGADAVPTEHPVAGGGHGQEIVAEHALS